MKLLVFGQTGQVAQELARRIQNGSSAEFLSRSEADLMQPEACQAAVLRSGADAVINAAAWTAVDKAETEELAATVVNGAAPGAMAAACAEKGIPFLTISTDYVFDGSGITPFRPGDPTGPLGAYGRSKLAGERAVLTAGGRALILRTSWIVSAHGSNFVKTMLRLGAERGGRPDRRPDAGSGYCRCAADLRPKDDGGKRRGRSPFLWRAGHVMGRFRARDHGAGASFLPDRGYTHRSLPDSGSPAEEQPNGVF